VVVSTTVPATSTVTSSAPVIVIATVVSAVALVILTLLAVAAVLVTLVVPVAPTTAGRSRGSSGEVNTALAGRDPARGHHRHAGRGRWPVHIARVEMSGEWVRTI
jgi:hypothetical protein